MCERVIKLKTASRSAWLFGPVSYPPPIESDERSKQKSGNGQLAGPNAFLQVI